MQQNDALSPLEEERLRQKFGDDVRTTLFLGSSTAMMTLLTAYLMLRWLYRLQLTGCGVLVVISLIASVVLWFSGKNDDRWTVLCTLINHFGIGIGLYLLLTFLGTDPRALDLALGILPGLAVFGVFCLLYVRLPDTFRKPLSWCGCIAFVVLIIVGISLYSNSGSAFGVVLAVCSAVLLGAWGALLWTCADPERSIHRTMAVVSFSIYLILLAIAAALLILQVLSGGKSSDNKRKSGSSSASTHDSRSSVISSHSSSVSRNYRRRYRGPSFFYPLYYSTYHRPYYTDRGVVRTEDPVGKARLSKFVKWAFVILAVLLTALLMAAIVRQYHVFQTVLMLFSSMPS